MGADRDDRPGPDTITEQAKDMTARARRRGGEAGRLRLRHLEIILVVAVQCGLAAALSWAIAHEVLDRPAPVFAPSAAVGTIVAALGQRAKRTFELMLGVGLGLLLSDLLVLYIGFGPWQIGLVVTLAIAVALLLTGRSGAVVAQAGSTAVLIATLSPTSRDLELPRILDAVVGSVVGLVVGALLLPINPMRVLDRTAAPVVETLGAQLREIAHALRQRDPDRAMRALDQLRGMEPDLARLHEALAGAKEVVTISPPRWRRRQDVERYRRGMQHFDRVALECRELVRWATTSLQYDEPAPEELIAALERLAQAVQLLHQETRRGQPPEQTRQAVLDAARLAGQARARGLNSYGDAMVTQLRTAASDLLRASGYEPETANRMVREAAQGGSA
ncbi:FUSC family protein [Micromonospora sp. 4G57]|uniref:FUSC family protein n=1 Tax=Micromonospora sicca TaxID=2202420 RepID=A0ABU5J994_9ACTN|nr:MULTISPECIES: FUSC family protein [unclassified Micromonospora]MDZ5442347.1 FUSC family protein [Micromonospora sp. 4G57]MDZ5489152.1 FUSC family protein [Micromonospora sp. 4G53]